MVLGDTAMTPYSTGTWGSRAMVMAGGAVAAACNELAERATRIGAHLLQADPKTRGSRTGGCSVQPARSRCRRSRGPGIDARRILPPTSTPAASKPPAATSLRATTGTFSYAAHAVAVAVDPELGEVEILDYVVVEDGGVLVNPLIVDGQIMGGARAGHRHRAL